MKINKKITAGILTAAMFFTMVPVAYANKVTDENNLPVDEQAIEATENTQGVDIKEETEAPVDLIAQKSKAKEEIKKLYNRYLDLDLKDIKIVNSKIDKATTEEEINAIVESVKNDIFKMEKKSFEELFADFDELINDMGDVFSPSEIKEIKKILADFKAQFANIKNLDELEAAQVKFIKEAINEGIDKIIPALEKLHKDLNKAQIEEIKNALNYFKTEINKINNIDELEANIDRIIETALDMISPETLEILSGIMYDENQSDDSNVNTDKKPAKEKENKPVKKENKPNTPQTGDPIGLGLLLALAGVSGIGTLVLKKKK